MYIENHFETANTINQPNDLNLACKYQSLQNPQQPRAADPVNPNLDFQFCVRKYLEFIIQNETILRHFLPVFDEICSFFLPLFSFFTLHLYFQHSFPSNHSPAPPPNDGILQNIYPFFVYSTNVI